MERVARRRRDPGKIEQLRGKLAPAKERMAGPAGDDVPAGQDLAEGQPGAFVEDVDRADREIDAVGMSAARSSGR